MARVELTLRMDTAPIVDSINLVGVTFGRLARHHGDRFRRLERQIERLAEDGVTDVPVIHDLGEGHFVSAAPKSITEILREARRLEVI